jgi:hypothetical protein
VSLKSAREALPRHRAEIIQRACREQTEKLDETDANKDAGNDGPIEKMWSKIKASLRSAQARTQPALNQSDRFGFGKRYTPGCHELVCHCGYSFI